MEVSKEPFSFWSSKGKDKDSLVEQSNLENNIKNVMQRISGKVSGFPLVDGEKEQPDEFLEEELEKKFSAFSAGCLGKLDFRKSSLNKGFS